MAIKFFSIFLIFVSIHSVAADFGFSNITQAEMENIVNEFSVNFAPTSVSGAASLGKVFGFELGFVGGATKAPNVEAYAERTTSQDAPNSLPHALIFAAVSLPYGFTVEAGGAPKVKIEGGDFNYGFFGAKWTFFDTLFDAALKLNVGKVGFSFAQNSGGVNGTVDFQDTIQTFMIMASKNFVFIEPYVGIGSIKTDGKIKVTGTGTVFDTTYTSAQEATQSPSGSYFAVGANMNLFVLKFGLEIAKGFGTQSVSAKFAFYF